MNNGLIFWTVNKINKTGQFKVSATLKIHEWKGAAPNLILKPTKRRLLPTLFKSKKNITILIIIRIDAKVCVRKYLTEPSLDILVFLTNIRGKKAKVFNSNPNHEIKSEGEDKIKKTLDMILISIRIKEGENHIRKEVLTYKWGMNPLALLSLPVSTC